MSAILKQVFNLQQILGITKDTNRLGHDSKYDENADQASVASDGDYHKVS